MQICCLAASLVLMVPSCNHREMPDSMGAGPMVLAKDEVLAGKHLSVWPTVDTTDAVNREAIDRLRCFFDQKHQTEAPGDFWYAGDMKRYVKPYNDLLYVEYDSVGDLKFLPTLIRISHIRKDDRLLTVKWADPEGAGSAADVPYVFDFHVRRTPNGMRLSLPLEHNTELWERHDLGTLHYIVSPAHRFDPVQAQEQADAIQDLAEFFNVEPFPINFYLFMDPSELFRARGFQVHPRMFTHPTGGMVDAGENVYSGNNKEVYTHEIVHLFTERKFDDRSDLLEEGLATLLGGSGEHPYAWHRDNLRRHLQADPTMDLSERLDPYVQYYINEHTNVPYVIGAILCEKIIREQGKEVLYDVITLNKDPWPALADLGISKSELTQVLLQELEKPVLDPLGT